MICVCRIKFSIIKLFNFRIFLKLYFSLIDFFAISLVQPAGGIWFNSHSPEDNQVKPTYGEKTRRGRKPKLDLHMVTPKIKGKASSNLFKLHSLPNKYSPHHSRDAALPKPKPNSYWETNVVCLTYLGKPVAAPSKCKKKTSSFMKEISFALSRYAAQHFDEGSSRQAPSFVLVKAKEVSRMLPFNFI